MSAPVDVLAVMDKDRRTATRVPVEDYTKADHFASVEARTAVATLIAAAVKKANDGCPCDNCEALRVAVRNCGGDA